MVHPCAILNMMYFKAVKHLSLFIHTILFLTYPISKVCHYSKMLAGPKGRSHLHLDFYSFALPVRLISALKRIWLLSPVLDDSWFLQCGTFIKIKLFYLLPMLFHSYHSIQGNKTMLYNIKRNFGWYQISRCGIEPNVVYLLPDRVASNHLWLLSAWNVASITQELNF